MGTRAFDTIFMDFVYYFYVFLPIGVLFPIYYYFFFVCCVRIVFPKIVPPARHRNICPAHSLMQTYLPYLPYLVHRRHAAAQHRISYIWHIGPSLLVRSMPAEWATSECNGPCPITEQSENDRYFCVSAGPCAFRYFAKPTSILKSPILSDTSCFEAKYIPRFRLCCVLCTYIFIYCIRYIRNGTHPY